MPFTPQPRYRRLLIFPLTLHIRAGRALLRVLRNPRPHQRIATLQIRDQPATPAQRELPELYAEVSIFVRRLSLTRVRTASWKDSPTSLLLLSLLGFATIIEAEDGDEAANGGQCDQSRRRIATLQLRMPERQREAQRLVAAVWQ